MMTPEETMGLEGDAEGVLVTTVAGLPSCVGRKLGPTKWRRMDQSRVDRFADVTDDHNFIHVDPERARRTPFGGTIAHGFLTLAMIAPISQHTRRRPRRGNVDQLRARQGALSVPPPGRGRVPRIGRNHGSDAGARGRAGQGRFHDRSARFAQARARRGVSAEVLDMIKLDAVVAIDVHTHAQVPLHGNPDPRTMQILDAAAKHFRSDFPRPNVQELADYYRQRSMAAVVFCVDCETRTGEVPVPNDEVLEIAAANDDVLIPFVSIDPHRTNAASEARRLVTRGARGFKFHPNLQGFFPNDRMAYPLYEAIAEARLPAMFHTGHSGMGSGMPGGGGIRLKYSNPMFVDDVAVDFPDMPIVLAHPSFPWQEEAISVAMHKPQVYIDLSGWSPKLFPPVLVQYANGPLRSKVLFGSDYPVLTPDRWLAEFAQLPIRDDVRPLVLKQNAVRLLRLDGPSGGG